MLQLKGWSVLLASSLFSVLLGALLGYSANEDSGVGHQSENRYAVSVGNVGVLNSDVSISITDNIEAKVYLYVLSPTMVDRGKVNESGNPKLVGTVDISSVGEPRLEGSFDGSLRRRIVVPARPSLTNRFE